MVPKNILFCTDFSPNSRPACRLAADYAAAFGAELLILHVVSSRLLGYPTFEDRIMEDLAELDQSIDQIVREELETVAKGCSHGLPAVRTVLRSGQPAVEIVRFARKNSVGLIVVGTHGWTGLRHLLLGSTAENVIRTAHCPVVAVKSVRTASLAGSG